VAAPARVRYDRTMRPLIACAALVSLLAAGCAGTSGAFRCPGHGGPAWRELATENFVLRTDLRAQEAGALLGRLERMRAAVAAVLFADAEPVPGRVEVIAFRSSEEYRPFAPDGANGYYFRVAGGPPRIVLSGDLKPWQRGLLAHELTHHFLAGTFQRQPRWFAEGLAVYMEALGEDAPGRPVTIGAPPPARLERARAATVPVRELLAWDGALGGRRSGLDHYAGSLVLVHWLVHRRPGAFDELQRRLAAGEPPGVAWRAVLPEYDPDRGTALEALDAVLAAYLRSGIEHHAREVEVPPVVGYFERPIPTPEVHAIRLALWPHGPDKGDRALRAEVAETLAEDPAHPVALQILGALDHADPVPLARRAIAAHPDDPRGWSFLASSLAGAASAEEREAAYRRAAELAPQNPAALHNLGQELFAEGRSGEALPSVRRAAQLAPFSPPLLAGYAAVLSDLGRCAQAIPVLQRAIDALPDGATAEDRAALVAKRDAYAAQCRESPAAARATTPVPP
jgi:Flp pilus assembly protein TadD